MSKSTPSLAANQAPGTNGAGHTNEDAGHVNAAESNGLSPPAPPQWAVDALAALPPASGGGLPDGRDPRTRTSLAARQLARDPDAAIPDDVDEALVRKLATLGDATIVTATQAAYAMVRLAPGATAAADPAPLSWGGLEAPLPPPEWTVDGLYERGTLVVYSGDTGAAKSIQLQDLAVSAALGRPWLGRYNVHGTRTLYLDEENPERLVLRRMQSLGLREDTGAAVRYMSRTGITVNQEAGLAWLHRAVRDHAAEIVVIDTATSATDIDPLDNGNTSTFLSALRRLAAAEDVLVILLAHERKRRADERYDASQSVMGARAWVNQADVHTAAKRHEEYTEEEAPNGALLARSSFVWQPDTKGREGKPNTEELLVVRSQKVDGRMVEMSVTLEGPVPSAREDLADEIGRAVHEAGGQLPAGEIAETLGVERGEGGEFPGGFHRARRTAQARGYIIEGSKRGRYAPGPVEPGETGGLGV